MIVFSTRYWNNNRGSHFDFLQIYDPMTSTYTDGVEIQNNMAGSLCVYNGSLLTVPVWVTKLGKYMVFFW